MLKYLSAGQLTLSSFYLNHQLAKTQMKCICVIVCQKVTTLCWNLPKIQLIRFSGHDVHCTMWRCAMLLATPMHLFCLIMKLQGRRHIIVAIVNVNDNKGLQQQLTTHVEVVDIVGDVCKCCRLWQVFSRWLLADCGETVVTQCRWQLLCLYSNFDHTFTGRYFSSAHCKSSLKHWTRPASTPVIA